MKPALPNKLHSQLGLEEQSGRFTGGGKAYALKDRKARRKAARRQPRQHQSITTKPAALGKHAHKRKVRHVLLERLITHTPLLSRTGSKGMIVRPLSVFRRRMGFPLPAQGSRPRSSRPPQHSPVLWPFGGSKPRRLLLHSPELLNPAKQCSLTPFPAGRSASHALLSAGAECQ